MNIAASLFVLTVVSSGAPGALDQNYNSPDWRGYMLRELVPYHKLVAADFRLTDRATDMLAYTTGFIEYSCDVQVSRREPFQARVVRLKVWSGLDRNLTWRRRNMPVTHELLAHEQGHLDINEIAAYRFASTRLSWLPTGRGRNPRDAERDLRREVDRYFQGIMRGSQLDQESYDLETRGGMDRVAQARWSEEISRRMIAAGVQTKWAARP